RRHTRFSRDWSSDVCSSDLAQPGEVNVTDPEPGLVDRHESGRPLKAVEGPAKGAFGTVPVRFSELLVPQCDNERMITTGSRGGGLHLAHQVEKLVDGGRGSLIR